LNLSYYFTAVKVYFNKNIYYIYINITLSEIVPLWQ
jgi:hypothetical protein